MRRPLSQMERVVYSIAEDYQIIGAVAARIAGELSAEKLRSVLTQVRIRHPQLGVRIGEQHRWGAYFLSDGVPDPPLRIVEAEAEDTWVRVIEEELTAPFSCATGPLFRFALVRWQGHSDLIIIGNHIVMDGATGMFLLEEVLQHLGDPAAVKPPPPAAPALEELLPPLVSQGAPRRPPRQRPLARGPAPSSPTGQAGPVSVLPWSLPASETTALIGRSRAERTTVYAAICAAFLRTFADLDPSTPIRTMETPIDVRERLTIPVGKCCGNYICLEETALECAPGRSLWELARLFKENLSHQMERNDLFRRWRQMKRFAAWMPSSALSWLLRRMLDTLLSIHYDISISNLGRLAFPSAYGPLPIAAVRAPVMRPATANHRILGVLTYNDQLIFSLATRDRQLAQQIKERAMEHLRAAL